MIRQLAEMLRRLPPDANKAFKEMVIKATETRLWMPTPGPQLLVVQRPADETFFGGSAGGSKTNTLIGLGLTALLRSLILRRTNKEASKLVDEIAEEEELTMLDTTPITTASSQMAGLETR
jgi:hypothetical protein